MSRTRTLAISPLISTLLALVAALALALALALGGPARAQDAEPITLTAATSDLGTYLTGPNGHTLYFFTRDAVPGVSNCAGGCLEAWPPLLVAEGQGVMAGEGIDGVIASAPLADGTSIVTYDGRPLYSWAKDTAPGETLGQGVANVWFVAMVDGSAPANQPAITIATTTTELGTFLTGKDGFTLYIFLEDVTPGVSTCEDECATHWPPLTVPWGNAAAAGEGVTGVVGVRERADGRWQVTYDGRPLYYWSSDLKAGDTNGNAVGDVWYVAAVDGHAPVE